MDMLVKFIGFFLYACTLLMTLWILKVILVPNVFDLLGVVFMVFSIPILVVWCIEKY
jgi:hypothetical protein